MLIPRARTYDEIYQGFRWQVPERFNMAEAVCDRHAGDEGRPALIYEGAGGEVRAYTFRDIQRLANRFANTLLARGLSRGDRVILVLGQRPETAIAHVACWKAGMISVPTSVLFGADAIEYRLNSSEARALVTDRDNYPKVAEIRDRTPALQNVFLVDGAESGALDFWQEVEKASDRFLNVDTSAEDPAFLNYTSGTTGMPKGALQAHRSIIGHMPGIEFVYDFFPQDGDLMWSPADWAWMAGLMDILMPAWFHGKPVLAFRATAFDPEQACHMMGKHKVRNALLTPTMLKLMRKNPEAIARNGVRLRSVLSGGESVGKELLEWSNQNLGCVVNEAFGQTECNLVLGNCASVMPVKPGALGRPIPGHVGAIVDEEGNVLPPAEMGQIAFRRPDPVMLLEYWRNPEATREKFAGDWLLTGDLGVADEDGYFWFHGRADDVITSSGYRIGPGEIEDALLRHPAVLLAAAIGVPDPVRTESIKAFLVLRDGRQASPELEQEIRDHVRTRLAKHEYPRMIEFVDSLPMTTTGKIMRRELRQREREKAASAS